jgi:hypothetical protein
MDKALLIGKQEQLIGVKQMLLDAGWSEEDIHMIEKSTPADIMAFCNDPFIERRYLHYVGDGCQINSERTLRRVKDERRPNSELH